MGQRGHDPHLEIIGFDSMNHLVGQGQGGNNMVMSHVPRLGYIMSDSMNHYCGTGKKQPKMGHIKVPKLWVMGSYQ